MLALHFFKPGTLPNTARHSLQDLYHQRLIADDMGDLEQGAEDASLCLEQATVFVDQALGLVE